MSVAALAYQPFAGLTGKAELHAAWAELSGELEHYLEESDIALVLRAAAFGARAHEGQMRQSGEPYFTHPIAVAKILASQRFDLPVLQAALLHDVLEDTPITMTQMQAEFGAEVTAIVDGVSKLERLKDQAPQEAQADSFKKMLVATTDDPRVIIIKLADRLHNMQTLGALRPDKRVRKARETLDVYASIAGRLGLFYFRIQLEDLAFSHLYPWRFAVLQKHYQERFAKNSTVGRVRREIMPELEKMGISASVTKRRRHLWGVYQRMLRKESFSAAVRTTALRIITKSEDDCYRILGVLHRRYRPISGKFEDYIAAPKSNGYRSLHSSMLMARRDVLNVQIRTRDMHHLAETGIIAVWHQHLKNRSLRKEKHNIAAEKYMRDWLSRLREVQNITDDPLEFYDAVKKELGGGDLHVYTPAGEVIDLPHGATPVDFAYAIHTDIGNHCIGAKVNGLPYAIFRPLQVAQTVDIITDDNAHPHAGWLQFVVTAKARAAINHHLRSLKQQEACGLGGELLRQALRTLDGSTKNIPRERLEHFLHENRLDRDTLFNEIACGKRQAGLVAAALLDKISDCRGAEQILRIRSSRDPGIRLAQCCHPVCGDSLSAHIDMEAGILVHRKNCAVAQITDREDWLQAAWADAPVGTFTALLHIDADNRPGMLSAITDVISRCNSNISNLQIQYLAHRTDLCRLRIWLDVENRDRLARIIRRLRLIDGVVHIERA